MAFGIIPQQALLLMVVMFSTVDCMSVEQLCDTIFQEVTKCEPQEVVLITGECSYTNCPTVDDAMVKVVLLSGTPFVHYVITNNTHIDDVMQILLKHTINQHLSHTTFIITATRFDYVIDSAERFSRDKRYQRGLLWLHTTRWFIVSKSYNKIKNYFTIHNRIPMDNIAFVSLDSGAQQHPTTISNIVMHTLTWQANRTRESLRINSHCQIPIKDKCAVFPNICHGLNGRHLTIITKIHWGFFVYVEDNPDTNKLEYQGFLIDVLHVLASFMNFSYTLTPDPALYGQASWDEVAHNVTEGEADLSATTWSYSWVQVFNIFVTYPILLDTFTGVYRRQTLSDEYMSLYIMCPFNSFTYVLLLASLFYTIFFYLLIVGFIYPHEDNEEPRNPFTPNRSRQFYSGTLKDSLAPKPSKLISWAFMNRVRSIAWSLVASVLNQAYLPHPTQMSARLLLFMWSMAMVMFYAIYTGCLTAEMIDASNTDAIDTFSELVSRSDYRWGTTDDSIIDKVMKTSNSTILYNLNRGKENIQDGANGDIYHTLKYKIEDLTDDFVFIHFKSVLNQIVGVSNSPEDYVFMKDTLLSANQGFIVSQDSELAHAFSDNIRKMHDSGIIDKLYDNYAHGNRTSVVDCEDTQRKALTLDKIQWPLAIIALLVVFSLVVLLVERLWLSISAFRRSEGTKK